MAGKTKSQKKKRAKMKKRTVEERNQLKNKAEKKVPTEIPTEEYKKRVEKILASKPADEVNNNAEPSSPKVNEDAGKDAAMLSYEKSAELGLKRVEETVEEMDITDQIVEASKFDPTSVVANILKKKNDI